MWEFPEKFLGLFKDSLAILQAACGAAHLQVLLVVVEDHGEEDGHEDEGVDQDVDDEEDGEGRAGVVRRHPEHRGAAAWASAGWGGGGLGSRRRAGRAARRSHDVGAVGRGDQHVEVEHRVGVVGEVRRPVRRLQVPAPHSPR